ncbi:MAG TPA: ATP-binding protein, partial [Anaerolineae bacterium]|nr:ATP-binding protein [Anaerolineae bacterium]
SVESATVHVQLSAWQRVRRNTSVRIGGTVMLLLVLISLAAPWMGASIAHARLRFDQDVPLGDLVREYQMLRREMWEALRRPLEPLRGGEVYSIAADLDMALDTMAIIAASTYGGELLRIIERLEPLPGRLQTVLEQIPSGVTIAEAPSGRIILANRQAGHILRRPFAEVWSVADYAQFRGYHTDGRPYAPEEWPLARAVRGEAVADERIEIERDDGTRGTISINAAPIRDRKGDIVAGVVVLSDITTHEQAEKERHRLLRVSETRRQLFEAVFNNIDAPIALLRGPDLVHELVNPAWQALEPWKNMQGKPYAEVWPGLARWVPVLHEVVRSRKSFFAKEQFLPLRPAPAAPPQERYFTIHVVPIFDPEAKEPALLVMDIETTEEVQARRDAETALRLCDEFLAVAAHELRTPVTSLRGYAELTMKRIEAGRIADPQELRRAFESIDRQAERLSILANQLLDLTELESGQLTLRRRETELVALVRRLVATMQAATTRHTLTLHAPASLSANVDPERLRLVLYNLLDNAIKYSPQGGPVEVELSTPDAATVRIAVRDHGPGIPPEQRPQLFTRFFKAGVERPAGGLGLGLYIGQRIVALHGGTLSAEFPADGGSRFVVQLPGEGAP